MAKQPSSRQPYGTRTNTQLLALALLVACVLGFWHLLDPIEQLGMRPVRDRIRSHAARGGLLVVAIDDRSLAEMGPAPWSNQRVALLLHRLRAAGARRIAVDVDLTPVPGRPPSEALTHEFRAGGKALFVPLRVSQDLAGGKPLYDRPPAAIARVATTVNANMWVQWSYVWSMPYAVPVDGRPMATLASAWTGVGGAPGELFPLDYSIDIRSIGTISAADILRDRWSPADAAGKDIIVGMTSAGAPHYSALGYGLVPSAYLNAVAVETLLNGRPLVLAWPFSIAFAGAIAAIFMFWRRRIAARVMLTAGFVALLAGPLLLEQRQIFVTVMPGLILLSLVACTRQWVKFRRSYQQRGTTNPVSGLPNLEALRLAAPTSIRSVVLARILNFSEALIALPAGCEGEMVEQIVKRLSFGAGSAGIYQSNDGVFLWLDESLDGEALTDQLGALHALFRSPVVVSGRLVDLSITFGLDCDTSRTVVQRASSALVAAEKAASDGQRWMTYDPAELEDAEWRMSLLARLDQAIDNGEIWVAYQPKIDLADGTIVGAEALARWTHPEKGDIPPVQFIAAAERSGRIDRLTVYVLDAAVRAAASINQRFAPFNIAVNLSSRMLERPNLVEMVADVLSRHRLPPESLYLEITETMAMADQETALKTIHDLAAIGVRLSIDDYGTGFSTLEYLRMIPAEEIKIDRSFISMLEKSQGDRIMVHSTIQLAHSLGRRVVAEGVENAATLNELRMMNCDYVQGYHTGRPARLPVLIERLEEMRRTAAA